MRYGNSENAHSFMEYFLEECRYLFSENYHPLVKLRGNFWFDLIRDTKMKMNLIGEKSLRHARNIIQRW